ncbi:MAG: glycosyltransferase [Arenicella sp.]
MTKPSSSNNKPRVLFICPQPFFEWRGSPIRVKANVTALSELGYDVDLLTLPIGAEQHIDNVRIIRGWDFFGSTKISIGPSLLKLWFDMILLIQGLTLIMRNKYQILHGTEEAGFICYLLSLVSRKQFIFEKHSDSNSYQPSGLLKPILKLYRLTEKLTIIKSNSVISTGPALDEQAKDDANISQSNIDGSDKFFVIPDTPSSTLEPSEDEINQARQSLISSPDDVIISYAGSFASYQGIDIIFDAIPSIVSENPHAKFAIIGGSSSEITHYQTLLKQQGVEEHHIQFLGKIHPDKLPAYLAAADILLAPRKSGVNSPLKILDYFKAGAAIVATNTSANQRLLNNDNAVLCEFSATAFSKAIKDLSSSKEQRERLGKNAHKLYKTQYNFEQFKQQLGAVYQKLNT